MAWIVKPSATQPIDRREEPYLTDEMKAKLEAEMLPRFPTKHAALLPVLHEIQHRWNWIPYQAMEEAAAFLELTPADVIDATTFYEEFFLEPKGQYLVQVCQSISCELCGEPEIWRRLQDKLDIVEGETTDDERFTLMTAECLGACGGGPVVLINGQLYENVTWERLEAVIDGLPEDPQEFKVGEPIDLSAP